MIFIFSSFATLPDNYFDGYAFVGNDFVSGTEGAEAFRSATGREITGGSDGCYLSIWRDGLKQRIAVDHSGYKKLFYYRRGRVWGVSNSVVRLASHLRENGIYLPPDPVQIRSLSVESTITSQLSTFSTVVSGISLLPSNYELEVAGGELSLVERPMIVYPDYSDSLKNFVETWVARLETLLADGRIQITCDLTGGKDSRVVFGLLMKARSRLGLTQEDICYLRSGTGAHWRKDLEAATTIANHYKVELNLPIPEAHETIHHGSVASYTNWKDLSVCQYFPVYFAPKSSSQFSLHLHGGGGENHRPFYPYSSFGEFEREFRTTGTQDDLLDAWIAGVGSTLKLLRERSPELDQWILHYRELRSRLHAGRAPQYRSVLSPLAGRDMDGMSRFPEKVRSAQAHFDVMSTLFPELLHFPYDTPSKGPSTDALDKLTVVTLGGQASPGKVFVGTGRIGECMAGGAAPLDMLFDDLSDAITPEVKRLAPDVVDRAVRARELARGRKSFVHASDGKNITRVLSVSAALAES